jgi:hypothetical protein
MLQLKYLIIFTLIAPVVLEIFTNEKLHFHPEIDDVKTNGIITINVNGNLRSCTVTHKGKVINTYRYLPIRGVITKQCR